MRVFESVWLAIPWLGNDRRICFHILHFYSICADQNYHSDFLARFAEER